LHKTPRLLLVEKMPKPNDFLGIKELEKSNQQVIQKRKPKVISRNVYVGKKGVTKHRLVSQKGDTK